MSGHKKRIGTKMAIALVTGGFGLLAASIAALGQVYSAGVAAHPSAQPTISTSSTITSSSRPQIKVPALPITAPRRSPAPTKSSRRVTVRPTRVPKKPPDSGATTSVQPGIIVQISIVNPPCLLIGPIYICLPLNLILQPFVTINGEPIKGSCGIFWEINTRESPPLRPVGNCKDNIPTGLSLQVGQDYTIIANVITSSGNKTVHLNLHIENNLPQNLRQPDKANVA